MAAKGTISKENIKNKIMEVFADAFIASDGKTIRIPMTEEGEVVEIKVTLTAAKDIEGNGAATSAEDKVFEAKIPVEKTELIEPTEEEKAKIDELLKFVTF